MRKRAAEQEDEGEQDPAAAIAAATVAAAKRSKAAKGGSTFATRRDEDDSKLRTFNFESSNALQQHSDMGATAVLETETQHDRDARCDSKLHMLIAAHGFVGACDGVPGQAACAGFLQPLRPAMWPASSLLASFLSAGRCGSSACARQQLPRQRRASLQMARAWPSPHQMTGCTRA